MGSIVSAVTELTGLVGAVRQVANFVENPASLDPFNTSSDLLAKQQAEAMKELQQKQQVEERKAQAGAAIQKSQIAADAQASQDQTQAALMRAVAKQRAQFGAQGIAPDDGSGQAVLLGLYKQTDQDLADQQRIDSLRNAAIDQNLNDQYAVDVLQRTQLAQQQKLQRIAENY